MKTVTAIALMRDGTTASGCTRVKIGGENYSLQAVVPPGPVEVVLDRGYAFLPCPPEGTTMMVVDGYTEAARKPHLYDKHVKLPPQLCIVKNGRWVDERGQSRGIGPKPTPKHRVYE